MSRDWSEPVRYPDPAVNVLDRRFRPYVLGSAAVERLYVGCRWAEGPVWFGDGRYLLWSDIPNDRILRWDEITGSVTTFRQPADNANGNTRDRQGRLVTCEHGARRVTRTEHDGTVTVLMDSLDGKRLNAPNDVVVHADGGIWFTDPGYGIHVNYEGHKRRSSCRNGSIGWIPTPSNPRWWTRPSSSPTGWPFRRTTRSSTSWTPGRPTSRAIPGRSVRSTWSTAHRSPTAASSATWATAVPDGIRVDIDGNVWSAAGWGGEGSDGVHVFAPDGDKIGEIHLPEVVSNVCFGGVKRNRLFMTGSQSLYSIYVETQGVPYV